MLGKNEIEEIIPQRDPFLMIDEVEDVKTVYHNVNL